MAFAVGPYGIEYDPNARDSGSPALRRIVVFIIVVAAISFTVTTILRKTKEAGERKKKENVVVESVKNEKHELPPPSAIPDPEARPVTVRNLLLRLEEAERRHDLAMAVTTIEELCALPGDPAYDLYDQLFRRAGELNLIWLFDEFNARWVSDVKVQPGDNASRIAARYKTTLSCIKKLNPNQDLERIKAGETLKVMVRPRFNLIVHARPRTADLKLNGRFFKRYDLREIVTGDVGACEITKPLRQLLAEKGIWFSHSDRKELETLIPQGALLVISEM